MQPELIILSEYCIKSNIEPSFVRQLEEEGLIDISIKEGKKYLFISQLNDLERFSRMYYDLSINLEGIGAIYHLLERVNQLQREINHLHQRLSIFNYDQLAEEPEPDSFEEL